MAKGIRLETNGVLTEAGKAQQAAAAPGKSYLYNSSNYDPSGTVKQGATAPKDLGAVAAGDSRLGSRSGVDPTFKDVSAGKYPIDATQPSPAVQQATTGLPGSPTPDTVEFDAKTGAPLARGASTTDALGNTFSQGQKWKQGLTQANASGVKAGNTAGSSAGMIASTVAKDEAESTVMPQIIETEPGFVKSILEAHDEYYSPQNQRKSYLEEYKQFQKELGLEGINEKLLNLDKIIDGSEDMIRAEITAAGGFATDRQVLAMTNASNKQNIKNYNYLLEEKKFAMTQLDTMMQLSMADRKQAEDDFDRKIGFAFKVQEFTQKATDNARAGLDRIVQNIGYGGLLASTNGNAYEQGLIEKTLGLGAGGLAKMASYVAPMSAMDKLELENQQLQNKKLRQEIGGSGSVSTQVVESNGKKLLINSKTGETIKEIGGGETGGDMPLLIERGADRAKQLEGLISNSKGLGANAGMWRRTSLTNLQNAKDWQADVKNVLSRLTVDELGRVKADGVTFGALSDPERKAVGDAASALNAGMIMKDDGVTPTGQFNISEKKVRQELETILKYQKLDMEKRTGVKYDDYKAGNYISPDEKKELDGYYNNTNALTPGQFNPASYY